jgi:hypothetical protein
MSAPYLANACTSQRERAVWVDVVVWAEPEEEQMMSMARISRSKPAKEGMLEVVTDGEHDEPQALPKCKAGQPKCGRSATGVKVGTHRPILIGSRSLLGYGGST